MLDVRALVRGASHRARPDRLTRARALRFDTMRPAAALAALLVLAAVPPALAAELEGRVVAIVDGDTLDILTRDRNTVRVRLAEIDAPERRQPFGTRAREALSALAFGKDARVEIVDRDRWGRAVGLVYVEGLEVNTELVRQGFAWVFRKYRHRPALLELEADAKAHRRGLWGDPAPVPPWEWRRAPKRAPEAA